MDRRATQARALRIRAFREEVAALRNEGILAFAPGQADRINAHHETLLARFAAEHDVDISATEQQLSWGMRIASAMGALAFSLAVFLFFDFYWIRFSTPAQVALLTAAPLLAWGVTEFIACRFRTGYYTGLAALVALACFIANLGLLGFIFNITPTPNAFLVWGLFGVALAYRHRLPLLLGVSLVCLVIFAGAWLTILFGYAWPAAELPELYLFASLAVLMAPKVLGRWLGPEFASTYAAVGLLGVYLTLMLLVAWPDGSLLPLSDGVLAWAYDVAAFAVAAIGIWQSIEHDWRPGVYLSAGFLILYMLYDYCDWLWDEMPGYLFFLLLGIVSFAVILLLRRLRSGMRKATP